jgi:UDP-N-acetylglucosamine--N-acetylmuramyl-(pentapeptide) pyrophosphoryl-undecaprenol N-acetylglucosamine transferase
MCAAAEPLRRSIPGLRILHQTGERGYDSTVAAYEKLAVPVEVSKFEVFKFMDDMPAMFARADLILCRSGASTVAEIAAAGKPSVFVPFPKAADDHQRRNAEAMQTAGAAVMIEERDLTPEKLADTLAGLLSDAVKLKAMSTAARGMAHPNATKDIAELAASFVHS